jgi:hypothetical protein
MPTYQLVPSLVKLRSEFNALSPNRDKASDGWIGDARHAASVSDHNPDANGDVHAIDVDVDLKTPGLSMEKVVQFLLARCRSGQERRLKYVIYNRRIWAASGDWRTQDYRGVNPHDHHAHFSGKYDTASETSVASWHLTDLLEDDDMPLNDADKAWISKEIGKQVDDALVRYGRSDGDTTGRVYSRDGLSTTIEQDTKLLREQVAEILKRLTPPVNTQK